MRGNYVVYVDGHFMQAFWSRSAAERYAKERRDAGATNVTVKNDN